MYGKRAFDSEYIQYVALYNRFLIIRYKSEEYKFDVGL
jgi:hypothetical protein